jgi:hypothetical protein
MALIKCHQIWRKTNWKSKVLDCLTLGYEQRLLDLRSDVSSLASHAPIFGRLITELPKAHANISGPGSFWAGKLAL